MIALKDIERVQLEKPEIDEAISVVARNYGNVVDRHDLHGRDILEKFIDGLMGELAERMVLKWLRNNGKYAESAVDKEAAHPDLGHDINVKEAKTGNLTLCSVKSSISDLHALPTIIKERRLAITPREVRDVNVQVFFWLKVFPTKGESRLSVPAIRESALIGWFGKNNLRSDDFTTYKHEERRCPKQFLVSGHPMSDLLLRLK